MTTTALTHGHKCNGRPSPTYNSWRAMIERCTYAPHPKYEYYGGRGVEVDPAWRGRGGFARFLSDLGPRPAGRTLDRIDANGHYTAANCRWATIATQAWNRRTIGLPDEPEPAGVMPAPWAAPAPATPEEAWPF